MFSYVIVILFTVLYQFVTLYQCRGVKFRAKEQALAGLVCAITVVLSAFYIPLPTGASITAGSMLPIMLLALCYDYKLAFVTGWISGILVLFLVPVWQPIHWAQIFVEHMVCFSCLGYAGRFGSKKKVHLFWGIFLALALKIIAHILSGVVFFSQNAWSGWGAWGYSAAYNLSAYIPEAILTLLILLALPIPVLKKAIKEDINA